MALDGKKIIQDFPILNSFKDGKKLTYLDSTATSLKPRSVVDALNEYYLSYSANVFRGIYPISELATERYEQARRIIASFLHAEKETEIIFTRNTSESINLIAYALPADIISGGEIVTTIMEHHSNIVPWQQLCTRSGSVLNFWNCDNTGELNLHDLEKLITKKTKLLAFTALSNVLGTINPVKKIVSLVKRLNSSCLVLVDAAQWVPHMKTDVQEWGADFVAFSGHKMLGPTGIGVLWGKSELLEMLNPFNYGGEMIREVHTKNSTFKSAPHKFEAGTPNIAGAIGLGAAVGYLEDAGLDNIREHEIALTRYALKLMDGFSEVTVYGPKSALKRGGVIAFSIKGVHAHDSAQVLAEENICVRAGNHCAMPLHEYFKIGATVRASFYLYTTKADIDRLAHGIRLILNTFR